LTKGGSDHHFQQRWGVGDPSLFQRVNAGKDKERGRGAEGLSKDVDSGHQDNPARTWEGGEEERGHLFDHLGGKILGGRLLQYIKTGGHETRNKTDKTSGGPVTSNFIHGGGVTPRLKEETKNQPQPENGKEKETGKGLPMAGQPSEANRNGRQIRVFCVQSAQVGYRGSLKKGVGSVGLLSVFNLKGK